MPGRPSRRDDPFHSINSWDDGFEYIQPSVNSPLSNSSSGNYFSRPPQAPQPPRQQRYEPEPLPRPPIGRDYDPKPRRRSPGPIEDDFGPPRRHRRDQSPPMKRFSRSPSPIRRNEDRQQRPAYYPPPANQGRPRQPGLYAERSDPPMRRQSAREPRGRSFSTSPPPRYRGRASSYSRSPSPPPRRARGYEADTRDMGRERDRRPRAYDQDPRERAFTANGRDRGYDRDYPDRESGRSVRDRDPNRRRTASPPRAKQAGKSRPSAARMNSAKAKVSNMNPMWQKAALSALQAGGLAALNMRAEPGSWGGQKGARIATAALGAAAADAFTKGGQKGGKKTRNGVEELGGALGGMLIDRMGKSGSGGKSHKH